ncbi:MAG: hypothetical protein N2746_00680 [Deltaproteobacteria bacterium]|nr:hypothetical protein [Deltaproteobacteria bacterium]
MVKVREDKILVAIVHFFDVKMTNEAIYSIKNGTLVPKIAVVCKSNETKNFSQRDLIFIEDNENKGYAARLNKAGRYALQNHYDYAIFANNDIKVNRDTIAKMYTFIKANPNTIVAPLILYENGRIQSSGIRFNLLTGRNINLYHNCDVKSINERIIIPDAVTGTFFMVKTSVFKSIKFDEDYDFYFEDVSFCLGASESGIRPIVLREATIVHKTSQSIKMLPIRQISEMVTKNHIKTINKHFGITGGSFPITVPIILSIAYNVLYFLLKTNNKKGEALKGVISGAIKGIGEILK